MRCNDAEQRRGLTRGHGDAAAETGRMENTTMPDRTRAEHLDQSGTQSAPIVVGVVGGLTGSPARNSSRLRHRGA